MSVMTADVTAWRNGVRMVGAVCWRLERIHGYYRDFFCLRRCEFFQRDEHGVMKLLSEEYHAATGCITESRAQHWADCQIHTWLRKQQRFTERRIARIEQDITKAESKRRRK